MRLEQLRYLITIIECRSFNKASKILHITQPALTSSIKALEEEIGVKLLSRDNMGVIATTAGRKVYDDTIEFLKYFDEMVNSWKPARLNDSVSGEARILSIPTICAWTAEYLLPELHQAYPDISIPLEEGDYLNFIAKLRANKANIGLTATLIGNEEEDLANFSVNGFSAFPLLDDEYAIIMGREHPLAKKEILDMEDCSDLKVCTFTSNALHPKNPYVQVMKTIGQVAETSVFLSSRETITRLLYEGKHVTMLLEKMMMNSWAVREGLLSVKKIRGVTLARSRHWLLHIDKKLLTEPECRVVQWLKENYAKKFK